MYSNMKSYENICNCIRVIQQDKNRKLKSANCWQQTSLNSVSNRVFLFPEPRFQVKLLDANQRVKTNMVELNIFAAVEHKPNLKV